VGCKAELVCDFAPTNRYSWSSQPGLSKHRGDARKQDNDNSSGLHTYCTGDSDSQRHTTRSFYNMIYAVFTNILLLLLVIINVTISLRENK